MDEGVTCDMRRLAITGEGRPIYLADGPRIDFFITSALLSTHRGKKTHYIMLLLDPTNCL